MMTRQQLTALLDTLWADPEPGLVWDGKPDEILDVDGTLIETWHTPGGAVVRAGHVLGEEVYLVEVVT